MVSKVSMLVVLGALVAAGPAAAQDVNIVTATELTWRGAAANALAGASLDQGNVSSDGRRDLIIGAPGNGSGAGNVYVIFGGPVRTGDLSLASADAVINGASGSDRFGTATAAGNVRTTEASDKPRDIAVGAPNASGGKGIVYLFATGNGLPNNATRTAAVAGGASGYALRIIGRTGDQLGAALGTADIDHDGYREIIIGAPGTSRIYVVKADPVAVPSAGATIDLASTPPLAEIIASTITTGGRLGGTLAAGDVNGDNRSDLLLSAPLEDGAAGRVYMLPGRAAGWAGVVDLAAPANGALVFSGIAGGDQAGTSVVVPDFDGDGTKDIIIGAPTADPGGRANAGAVYVIWGGPGVSSRSLTFSNAVFWGEAAGHQTGAYIATGSINRDTEDDLVMLAYGARGGLGELHMFYGSSKANRNGAIDLAQGMHRRLFAEPAEGSIRTAAIFEVTGEGARDIIAGIPSANGSGLTNNGLVYFSLSPRMILSKKSTTIRTVPNRSRSRTLLVSNPGIGVVTWTATSNVPWLTVSPASGQSTSSAPGVLTLRTSSSMPAGTNTATVTVRSTTIHLTMAVPITVKVVCCQPTSDWEGDGVDDLVLYRPSNGNWMFRHSGNGFASGPTWQFGLSTDKPVPGDYDGDGLLDVAVYRPSNGIWYVIPSSTGVVVELQWGISTDVPIPADFTGDGRTELAVWRPSNGIWYIFDLSTGTFTSRQWGISTDIPLTGDYDGDGKADVVAFRPSNGYWYVFYSSTQTYSVLQWGVSTDIPLPADYTGDGRTDLAVYRPANGYWFVYDLSTASYVPYQWGISTDKPAPKDYDGDGRVDLAVYRPSNGTYYIYFLGSNTFTSVKYGGSNDVPVR